MRRRVSPEGIKKERKRQDKGIKTLRGLLPKAQPSGGSKNLIGFSFLVFHNSHLVVK